MRLVVGGCRRLDKAAWLQYFRTDRYWL